MKISIFQFSLFGINTYVLTDPSTRECAIVDPGMSIPEEEKAITDFIEKHELKPVAVINTHLHLDHAVGNNFLSQKYNISQKAHESDLPLGERMNQQAAMFGMGKSFKNTDITTFLKDGDTIRIGDSELKVIEVPGHSQGSIALYDPKDGFAIVGDALFEGSIGRTDLPGGNGPQLIKSIKEKLLTLPGNTVIYPGHGPATTIAAEKAHNPFLK